MQHEMHLHPEPFARIVSGEQKYEIRLLDEKRDRVEVGDTIIFTNREDGSQVMTEVEGKHIFANFGLLFDQFSELFPQHTKDSFLNMMDEWYPPEEQATHQVALFEIKLA